MHDEREPVDDDTLPVPEGDKVVDDDPEYDREFDTEDISDRIKTDDPGEIPPDEVNRPDDNPDRRL